MKSFILETAFRGSPIKVLIDFLEEEKKKEKARDYSNMLLVGFVLKVGYNEVEIITQDSFKKAVGGVPRGSFLVMTPNSFDDVPPHFMLLRVTDVAPTPLTGEVQKAYFELHRRFMPELDIFTDAELQWSGLKTKLLGTFYPDPDNPEEIAFSGDIPNLISPHKYRVYYPSKKLLDLIVNGTVPKDNQFVIGTLRLTECRLTPSSTDVPVKVSTKNFMGTRTAMFGKTRLGKSNVVKIIAQSLIETTRETRNVGQLIFDINGEYANDNPQDGSRSLRSAYEDRCVVYSIVRRPSTPSRPLSLNFYERPREGMQILRSFLERDGRTGSQYIGSFASVELPGIEEVLDLPPGGERTRLVRRIQMYWAILYKAGFPADESRLRSLKLSAGTSSGPKDFNPAFSSSLISAVFGNSMNYSPPSSLDQLLALLERVERFRRENPDHKALISSSGRPLFEADDEALLEFLLPKHTGAGGPKVLRPYIIYHNPRAGDFVGEILDLLDQGQTVILDLGNAPEELRNYYSDLLSRAVFAHQEKKFTEDRLGNYYVQIYFEEAHNLFPKDEKDFKSIYARFAKEGAKFHIGIVYSTQSPSTINSELLAQTENFFVAHMSSRKEVETLTKLQAQFEGLDQEILNTRTPGYMRVLTLSHRFVVPVQIKKFELSIPPNTKE